MLEGFAVDRKEVTVAPRPTASNTTTLDFKLGGPVPNAERNTTSTSTVIRNTFEDDLALQTWLKNQSANGLRLVSVIPVEDKTSLFVFNHVPPENNSATVVTVSAALDAASLTKRLAQYRSFVGV